MRVSIYVTNLPAVTDAAALRAHFAACGPVADVRVVADRNPGRGRGTAFVEMVSEAGATRALAELNGTMFSGQLLLLEPGPETPGKRNPKKGPEEDHDVQARITTQFRESTNMTYELDCGGTALVLRVFFPPPTGEWRILAQASRAADAPSVSSTASSRVQAIRNLARDCGAGAHLGALATIDWAAVERSMTKVRAI